MGEKQCKKFSNLQNKYLGDSRVGSIGRACCDGAEIMCQLHFFFCFHFQSLIQQSFHLAIHLLNLLIPALRVAGSTNFD